MPVYEEILAAKQEANEVCEEARIVRAKAEVIYRAKKQLAVQATAELAMAIEEAKHTKRMRELAAPALNR